MSIDSILTSVGPNNAEIQRLLSTASQQPWGPGREIDAKVHYLHQELLNVSSRLGSSEEKPDDASLAHKIDHALRNKLMVYQYHEEQRRLSRSPF